MAEVKPEDTVGEPVQVVNVGAADVLAKTAGEHPQECVCCVGSYIKYRCSLRPATCCCCLLCEVRCARIPLILFHVFLGIIAITHYAPIVRFIYRLNTMLGGLCFFMAAFVYAPLAACCALHQYYAKRKAAEAKNPVWSQRSEPFTEYLGACNRFTIISHALVFIFAFLILLPVLLMRPVASDLEAGEMEKVFGAGSPPLAQETALDFGQWLIKGSSTNGPYGPASEETLQTFVYKTGLPTSPPQDDCFRDWKPHLELDIHFPEACMRTNSCTDGTPLAPIIFHTHCGGWEVGDKSELCGGWSTAAYFLERGYAFVSPQYRFACHGYNATDMLSDIRDAYDYVRANATKFHLDSNSVHLMGGSAGGHLALMLGYTVTDGNNASDPGDYSGIKSITELYGITDIASLGTCTPDSKDKTIRTVTSQCSAEGMRIASPVSYITSNSPPTLIFHGTVDTLVPYEQAETLKTKLDAAGVPNYLIPVYSFDHVAEGGYYGVPAQVFRYAFERLLAAKK